jgi:hypothetical protein
VVAFAVDLQFKEESNTQLIKMQLKDNNKFMINECPVDVC